jgi:kynurenine formamidase
MQGGVLITEQVARLDLLRGLPFRLYALPIALAKSDGAPARVVAELQGPTAVSTTAEKVQGAPRATGI